MKNVMMLVLTLLMTGCPSSNGTVDAAAPKDAATDRAAEASTDGAACADAQTLCRGECVDTQSAFLHCGQCNYRCQGTQRCVGGACVRAGMCPTSCRLNGDCFLCTQEGDPTNFCCDGRNASGVGRCIRNLGPRCGVNP